MNLNYPPYNNKMLMENGLTHDSWNKFFQSIYQMFSPKSYYTKAFSPVITGITGTYSQSNTYIVDREFVHCQMVISGTGISLTNAKIAGIPDIPLSNTCVNYAVYNNNSQISSSNILLKTTKELFLPDISSGDYQIYLNINFLRNF